MSTTTIDVTVEGITRLTNTRNRNPRWRLTVSNGPETAGTAVYTTEPDAMCAYKVCDPMVGKRVTLTLDAKNQIQFIDWEIV
jgi:hypothetical protein